MDKGNYLDISLICLSYINIETYNTYICTRNPPKTTSYCIFCLLLPSTTYYAISNTTPFCGRSKPDVGPPKLRPGHPKFAAWPANADGKWVRGLRDVAQSEKQHLQVFRRWPLLLSTWSAFVARALDVPADGLAPAGPSARDKCAASPGSTCSWQCAFTTQIQSLHVAELQPRASSIAVPVAAGVCAIGVIGNHNSFAAGGNQDI